MPFVFGGETFDEVYDLIVEELIDNPEHRCSPRGQLINEILGATLVVNNPRARLLSHPVRKANYGFTTGEFLWYWTGKRDLETMLYYNKRMGDFSDDGIEIRSAYGYRLGLADGFSRRLPSSQWEVCRETLLRDPDSRRAVMHINASHDQRVAHEWGSKDVPCTMSLQFFVRDGRLDLHVHMRSNDAVWGLTNDLFSFTLFQEAMLGELRALGMPGLRLGRYVHHVGSLHLYERHFDMAVAYLDDPDYKRSPPMGELDAVELSVLVQDEDAIRTGKERSGFEYREGGACRQMLDWLVEHREKRDVERERA